MQEIKTNVYRALIGRKTRTSRRRPLTFTKQVPAWGKKSSRHSTLKIRAKVSCEAAGKAGLGCSNICRVAAAKQCTTRRAMIYAVLIERLSAPYYRDHGQKILLTCKPKTGPAHSVLDEKMPIVTSCAETHDQDI